MGNNGRPIEKIKFNSVFKALVLINKIKVLLESNKVERMLVSSGSVCAPAFEPFML